MTNIIIAASIGIALILFTLVIRAIKNWLDKEDIKELSGNHPE